MIILNALYVSGIMLCEGLILLLLIANPANTNKSNIRVKHGSDGQGKHSFNLSLKVGPVYKVEVYTQQIGN